MDCSTGKCTCHQRAKKDGILIPSCPPANDKDLTGKHPEAQYYIISRGNRGSSDLAKVTYDSLFS